MQTNTVSNQTNVPAPQRASVTPNVDASQFSAALNREIEQRQELAAAAPTPAPQPKPAAQAQPATPEQPQDAGQAPEPQPAAAPAPKQEPKKAAKSADDKDGDTKDGAKSAEHPATAQVTDMLALVASLKPMQEAAAAKTAGAHAAGAATGAIGKAGAGDAGHLAALQAAVKGLGKDDGQASAKALAGQDQLRNPAADALGAAAGDTKPGAKDGIDLRAFQDAAQLKLHPDAAPGRDALAEATALKDPAPAAPLVAPMQPVTLEVAQAAAAASGELTARVGSQAWENQVGQKIVWMVGGEEQSASLTLNPPDLGPMQVVLSVTNDQASVTFSSNQHEVRQALENALPRLREMMSESGIALGNASVNAGMPDQQQAQSGGGQPHGAGRPLSRFDGGASIADTAAVRPAPRVATLAGRGNVDTFA